MDPEEIADKMTEITRSSETSWDNQDNTLSLDDGSRELIRSIVRDSAIRIQQEELEKARQDWYSRTSNRSTKRGKRRTRRNPPAAEPEDAPVADAPLLDLPTKEANPDVAMQSAENKESVAGSQTIDASHQDATEVPSVSIVSGDVRGETKDKTAVVSYVPKDKQINFDSKDEFEQAYAKVLKQTASMREKIRGNPPILKTKADIKDIILSGKASEEVQKATDTISASYARGANTDTGKQMLKEGKNIMTKGWDPVQAEVALRMFGCKSIQELAALCDDLAKTPEPTEETRAAMVEEMLRWTGICTGFKIMNRSIYNAMPQELVDNDDPDRAFYLPSEALDAYFAAYQTDGQHVIKQQAKSRGKAFEQFLMEFRHAIASLDRIETKQLDDYAPIFMQIMTRCSAWLKMNTLFMNQAGIEIAEPWGYKLIHSAKLDVDLVPE